MQWISNGLILAALAPLLLVVAWVDARTGRIPDVANAAIAVLGAFRASIAGWEVLLSRGLDAAVVVVLLVLLRDVYVKCRKQQGLGLGDVKFLGAATLWIGLPGMPATILTASLLALLTVGLYHLICRPVSWTARLYFGPYLALALFSVLIAEVWT